MKKVLQIISAWGSGGVERYIVNFQKYINDEYSYDVLAIRHTPSKGLFTDEFINNGGSIEVIKPLSSGTIIEKWNYRIEFIINKIKNNDYKIIHLNGTMADVILFSSVIKKRFPEIKTIVHCHGDNIDPPYVVVKTFIHKLLKRYIGIYPDYALGCSKRTLDWMFNYKKLKEIPSKVLYCGIEIDKFLFNKNNRIQVRRALKCENDFLLGTIGRFSEQKNPMFILDILKSLSKMEINYKFLWIGAGGMQEAIKKKADELGILKNIIFYGTTNDTAKMYSAMDIFILPSLYEGNPIVGFEAQANGLLCLFSDKIVSEAKVSELVSFLPIDNSDIWANKIKNSMSHLNRQNMKKLLIDAGQDVQQCAKEVVKVYHILEED